MNDERFFTILAVQTDAMQGTRERVPRRLKSRLYSALVSEQAASRPLLSLPATQAAGRPLCDSEAGKIAHHPVGAREEVMADINVALAASRQAIDELIVAGEQTGPAWTAPRAPGKWSPSQIVEHVARSLEESANVAAGRRSKFPKLPVVIHPLVRLLLFKRVLKNEGFPKAKTNKAMDPESGPATPAEGRSRLETAHQKFDEACRQLASRGGRMATTIFGRVAVEDYVRFMEIHTRHHEKQIADRG